MAYDFRCVMLARTRRQGLGLGLDAPEGTHKDISATTLQNSPHCTAVVSNVERTNAPDAADRIVNPYSPDIGTNPKDAVIRI